MPNIFRKVQALWRGTVFNGNATPSGPQTSNLQGNELVLQEFLYLQYYNSLSDAVYTGTNLRFDYPNVWQLHLDLYKEVIKVSNYIINISKLLDVTRALNTLTLIFYDGTLLEIEIENAETWQYFISQCIQWYGVESTKTNITNIQSAINGASNESLELYGEYTINSPIVLKDRVNLILSLETKITGTFGGALFTDNGIECVSSIVGYGQFFNHQPNSNIVVTTHADSKVFINLSDAQANQVFNQQNGEIYTKGLIASSVIFNKTQMALNQLAINNLGFVNSVNSSHLLNVKYS